MIESTIHVEVTTTITLTAKQAALLKAMMQNPNCDPDDEAMEIRELREALFDTLCWESQYHDRL